MIHAYSVRPRNSDGPALLFQEGAPEAAAAAFLENWSGEPADEEAAVIVREIETGREHCFCVDLETGATRPCG